MVTNMWARIDNGAVAEITNLDPEGCFHPSIVWVACGGEIGPGWLYDGDSFLPPSEDPVSVAITSADVDAERDRRISSGFSFNGVVYQSRLPNGLYSGDWEVFSGKALEALIAVIGEAQPGDLRWSSPDEDFAWIAADNSRVPMDAQTVIELGKAASAHRSRHTFAGSDLKAISPIPVDFTNDKWWA